MFSTRAIYYRVHGFGASTMLITTETLPTTAADYVGAQGYVSEDGRRWDFSIRKDADRFLAVWVQQDGRPHYLPARLDFNERIQVGSYIDRLDHGKKDPDEYEIDYIGPELQ
jgi:hypothetical protein